MYGGLDVLQMQLIYNCTTLFLKYDYNNSYNAYTDDEIQDLLLKTTNCSQTLYIPCLSDSDAIQWKSITGDIWWPSVVSQCDKQSGGYVHI